jgi:hypothetical protein
MKTTAAGFVRLRVELRVIKFSSRLFNRRGGLEYI